jgi:DNA-binding transcriptional regulator YiaG
MAAKQTPESFWARVQGDRRKRNGCWEWQGACNNTGYGTVAWHGKVYTAHRVAAWLSGLVADPARPANAQQKAHVLHKCDNRKCCNPTHFFIGSYSDNQLDAYTKKRRTQPKGGAHANAKLTDKQAAEIRRIYKVHGLTQQTIANRYDVSQRVISLIVRGEAYK